MADKDQTDKPLNGEILPHEDTAPLIALETIQTAETAEGELSPMAEITPEITDLLAALPGDCAEIKHGIEKCLIDVHLEFEDVVSRESIARRQIAPLNRSAACKEHKPVSAHAESFISRGRTIRPRTVVGAGAAASIPEPGCFARGREGEEICPRWGRVFRARQCSRGPSTGIESTRLVVSRSFGPGRGEEKTAARAACCRSVLPAKR